MLCDTVVFSWKQYMRSNVVANVAEGFTQQAQEAIRTYLAHVLLQTQKALNLNS
jgi:hypothetical protein